MARTSNATSAETKTPAFQAYHVTNKGDDSFWTKVGAAWPHRDGKGLSLILQKERREKRVEYKEQPNSRLAKGQTATHTTNFSSSDFMNNRKNKSLSSRTWGAFSKIRFWEFLGISMWNNNIIN